MMISKLSTLTALLGTLGLVACVDSPEPDVELELDGNAVLAQSATTTRIDNGDGTYSLALPADVHTPPRIRRGAKTLRYDGQARLGTVRPTARMTDINAPARSTRDQLIGSITIDGLGRRWVTESIDEATLAEQIARYNAKVEAEVGREPSGGTSDPEVTKPELVLWQPESWNTPDCNSDGHVDMSVWDTDDRSFASSMTDRQKKSVLVSMSGGTCSGTMVSNTVVLTAAHCLYDEDGTQTDRNLMKVCTLGNYLTGAECKTVADYTINSGFGGGYDFADDFAVIRLDGSFSVGWMAISQASDSTIKSLPNKNLGYPGWRPSCNRNDRTPVNSGVDALGQWWSEGEVLGLSSSLMRTRFDTGGGHSGGTYYYFPSADSTAHYLTAVHSGRFLYGTNYYTGGPKGPAIRSWVIANM